MTDSLRTAHFITADELARIAVTDNGPVILDIGVGTRAATARERYAQGHAPAAVFVELEADLQAPNAGTEGKRPLPPLATLQAKARAWGISADRPVVVYDRESGTKAGRAWWVLRWAGVPDVRILDGGLNAWTRAGHPLTDELPTPRGGDVTLAGGHLPHITTDEAVALAVTGRLFDTRTHQQYADGHIPAARWASTRANLDADGLLRDAAWLRDRYATLGVDETAEAAFYCGGAVAAAHSIAVLASLGITASLYVPSFGGWSADPDREIALGGEVDVTSGSSQ